MEKSSLYISGVTPEFRNHILDELHFSLGSLPFKYLGVHLSATKLTINQCMPLVVKMVAMVRRWSSKFLSYTCRLQIIKSVLFEIQIYWAQIFCFQKEL